jgi:uncharacterized repeat protein (TIGR03803 family)
MRSSCTRFRIALLGSALALAALTPAVGASRIDSKRFLAIYGNRPPVSRPGVVAPAQGGHTYTVLHDFAGGPGDGANSGAGVTLDDLGNIYGTTNYGGANGDGTIFKLAPDGTLTVLHSFSGADGSTPDGALTLTGNGTLYGTTESGGASGNGVLFRLTSQGKFKVLHDFKDDDGSFLRGHLTRDKLGNFYGTALFGGINGDGTVFEYTADGQFSVLHAFNGSDGEFPEHGVVRDTAGNLYGVTAFGGTDDDGTVFKIAGDGTFSTLHTFTGDDGSFPYGGLAIDKAGNLYGSTEDGGANGYGAVIEYDAVENTWTVRYSFTGGADGASPAGDMQLVGGKLYSTANVGGDPICQCGEIYMVTSTGKKVALHLFNGDDGSAYSAGVTMINKLFYGTAQYGGANGNGVIYQFTGGK